MPQQLPKLRVMNFLFTTYEPGMIPGPGLSATETFLWFVVAPVALFVVIGAFAYASHGKSDQRNKKSSAVDSIDA